MAGNYIGLNATGNAAIAEHLGRGRNFQRRAKSNLVGGYTAAARNIISGNGLQGVFIAGATTTGNIVAGNYIGLNPAGSAAIANGYSGVEVGNGAQNNLIGSSNVISGNTQNGVLFNGTANNRVVGNYLGLNAAGTAAVPNGWAGVDFYLGAQSNLAINNVISGNANDGVLFYETGVSNNLVQGNFIGLNAAGTAAVSNAWAGVDLYYGPQFNQIGGATAAARNVISGNGQDGVFLAGNSTTGNMIAGNFIGLNASGTTAVANQWRGVDLYDGATVNLVGGTGGARNFISGNNQDGILIAYGSSANVIQGNTLGLDAMNNAAVPNNGSGVVLYIDAVSNLIGGVTPGAANLISGNVYDGVAVYYSGTTNNTIRGNSIFGNTGSAIALFSGGNNESRRAVTRFRCSDHEYGGQRHLRGNFRRGLLAGFLCSRQRRGDDLSRFNQRHRHGRFRSLYGQTRRATAIWSRRYGHGHRSVGQHLCAFHRCRRHDDQHAERRHSRCVAAAVFWQHQH